MNSHDIGLSGEAMACEYLSDHGLVVLETRYRGGGGEIDIVAREEGTLCFVEVKYRPDGRLGEGISAVTPDKWKKMRSAVRAYIHARGVRTGHRFDIVEITRAGVWHLKNARPADGRM